MCNLVWQQGPNTSPPHSFADFPKSPFHQNLGEVEVMDIPPFTLLEIHSQHPRLLVLMGWLRARDISKTSMPR